MTASSSERVDCRAVLAAVNALGANQRDLTGRVGSVEDRLAGVEERLTTVGASTVDTNVRVRSLEGSVAEMKDLLVGALDL